MEKEESLGCFFCGNDRNLTLLPIKINGKWQSICWPCENAMIIDILRYYSRIDGLIFNGREISVA